MSGPTVHFAWPTTFSPIPSDLPHALPPPVKERTLRSPFGIDPWLFNFALRSEIPILFAASYIILVASFNAYNKKRAYRPWWIARKRPFQWFVVLHNVLLAAYSFATFVAMLRAITHTWPGWDAPNAPAAWADALCKINGPRGLGDATTFNTTINIWEAKNTMIHLGYDGNPDPTDVGRLWNEGLAFWGWIFYVSKFYEVVDTLIILAKGKRSATLQTYHHAGAMLCMWAGIRYMSPPIWMFVFINSIIHAMMYTYFTFSALGYRVPQGLKRILTSLQIAQFVFGASYAALHLFVEYDIPIATPYQVVSTVQRVVSSVSSAATAIPSAASQAVASPIASATLGALIKKLLLRAAGEEGVAERVRNDRGELTTPNITEKIEYFNEQTYETRWRTDWTRVNCIDTSGEAFAIYLNLVYLLPLTVLFGRFFFRAYTQRGKPRNASQAGKQISASAKDAKQRTESVVERQGEKAEDELAELESEAADRLRKTEHQLAQLESEGTEKARNDPNNLQEQLRNDLRKLKEGKLKSDRRVSDRVASFERQVKGAAEKAKEQGKQLLDGSGSPRKASPSKSEREGTKDKGGDEGESEERAETEKTQESQDKLGAGDEQREEEKPARDVKGEQPDKNASANDGSSTAKDDEQHHGQSANSESEKKQDANMADSQATRPGTEDDVVPGGKEEESNRPTGNGAEGNKNADNKSQPPPGHGTNNESEDKQDENMAASQATRPGVEDSQASISDVSKGQADEDTDAMGMSGAIVDHPDDNKYKNSNNKAGGETKGAKRSGKGGGQGKA